MSQYSSPRGAAAGPTTAQRQQACCNTALLAISALCLAILAAKDGPEPPAPTLVTDNWRDLLFVEQLTHGFGG